MDRRSFLKTLGGAAAGVAAAAITGRSLVGSAEPSAAVVPQTIPGLTPPYNVAPRGLQYAIHNTATYQPLTRATMDKCFRQITANQG